MPMINDMRAPYISPDNVWWPYYHFVSDYIARCCCLLRQGKPHADVAVYSPLANQWTRDVLNARRWTRDFDWGDVGELLWANGYNFDLINDDALQNHCKLDGQWLRVGENRYGAIVIPNTLVLPLVSYQRIEEFAKQGGVVIALERTPEKSVGFKEHDVQDAGNGAEQEPAGDRQNDSTGNGERHRDDIHGYEEEN